MTFSHNSCSHNSVSLSVPNPELSLHKECGQSAKIGKKIDITAKDLSLGLVQIHLKMKELATGGFSLNWDYR